MKIVGILKLAIFAVLLTGCGSLMPPAASRLELPDKVPEKERANWYLVWSDEFDYHGLPDPAKWDYETGYVRNKELQYYTKNRSKNARVEDGVLIIETRKEAFQNTSYTSASLRTHDSISFLYGRIEVRAKLPIGRGMWPAIFMLGKNIEEIGWPACGEIDIMENMGIEPEKIYGNVHTKAYNWVYGTNKGDSIYVSVPNETFHIYAIEWFEDKIDFFVDNKKYFTFKNAGQGLDTWPFNKNHYLIINAAVGGLFGGKQGIDDSIFPQKFIVDYVRVYEN